jgi:hypothetical protein
VSRGQTPNDHLGQNSVACLSQELASEIHFKLSDSELAYKPSCSAVPWFMAIGTLVIT